MKCPHCGGELEGTPKFCAHCGQSIPQAGSQGVQPAPEQGSSGGMRSTNQGTSYLMGKSTRVTGPRPFKEIPSLWLKVFQMRGSFFGQERLRASSSNTVLGVVCAMVVAVLVTYILRQDTFAPTLIICSGVLGNLIYFYLGTGIIHLSARMLGGMGSFEEQAYLQSLFFVPIIAAQWVVLSFGVIGFLVSAALGIYYLVLTVRSLRVVHGLSQGKAIVAVIVLPILLSVVGVIVFAVVGATAIEGLLRM